MTSLESKDLLARLLAAENIWIQHQQVSTASFDVISRILTFPIWKDMSDELYTMLAGHEVSHALHSGTQSPLDLAKVIDPANLMIAAGYINIVEDARIERLIKSQYPGIRSIFSIAYKELFDRNMFNTTGVDLTTLSLIDRINLHFKIGHHLNISFSTDEQVFVAKVEEARTLPEVIAIAKEIYEWSKEHDTQQPQQPNNTLEEILQQLQSGEPGESDGESSSNDEPGESGDEPSDEPGECSNGDSGNDEDNKDGDGKGQAGESGKEGKEEGSKQNAGSGEQGEKGEKGDEKGGDGEREGSSTTENVAGSDKANSGSNSQQSGLKKSKKPGQQSGKPAPAPATQQAFDKNIKKLNDTNARENVYVTLPTPNLSDIMIDYTTVHKEIRKHYSSGDGSKLQRAAKEFAAFREENLSKVNYIYQRFEMKKQAERRKRIKQHTTGALDTLKLHAYKTQDDIFKVLTTVTDGKNHALLLVIDWSGSMDDCMGDTIKQLILLCLLARRAQIPFEVYSITIRNRKPTKSFSSRCGDLAFEQTYSMRCYLSSEMNVQTFNDACINLFAMMPGGEFESDGPKQDQLIGCTPLCEAVATSMDLIQQMKRKTHAEIVNAIFLTDGGANTVNEYYSANNNIKQMYGKNFLLTDTVTHKVYEFQDCDLTPVLLKMLRDRENINVVGFYIGNSYTQFFNNPNHNLSKEFKTNGFVISTEWGYNELYIINPDRLTIHKKSMDPSAKEEDKDYAEAIDQSAYLKSLQAKFIESGNDLMKERVMLDRFVAMIA